MKKKILFVSLANKFGSNITKLVADKLGMFFLNIEDFVEYNLFDSKKLLLRCGKSHFEKKEKESIRQCLEYDNTIYYCSYETLANYYDLLSSNCDLCYIMLTKSYLKKLNEDNFVINDIAFADRDNNLQKITQVFYCDSLNEDFLSNKIIKTLRASV